MRAHGRMPCAVHTHPARPPTPQPDVTAACRRLLPPAAGRRLWATSSSAGHLHRGRGAAFSLPVRFDAAITKGAVFVGADARRGASSDGADPRVAVAARGVPRASRGNGVTAVGVDALQHRCTCDAKKSAMARQFRLRVAQVAGCGCGEKRETVSTRADYAGSGAQVRRRTTSRSQG